MTHLGFKFSLHTLFLGFSLTAMTANGHGASDNPDELRPFSYRSLLASRPNSIGDGRPMAIGIQSSKHLLTTTLITAGILPGQPAADTESLLSRRLHGIANQGALPFSDLGSLSQRMRPSPSMFEALDTRLLAERFGMSLAIDGDPSSGELAYAAPEQSPARLALHALILEGTEDYANLPETLPIPTSRPSRPRRGHGTQQGRTSPGTSKSASEQQKERPRGLLSRLFGGHHEGIQGDHAVAVYDITAAKVYMPDGSVLEAHSGYGKMVDNPRYAHVRMRGPTPPHTYNLTMRESLFHGVEAIRMLPADGKNKHGRDGFLAHTYLLRGRPGESHGCVSFKDYDNFLNAFKRGKVKQMVVVSSGGRATATRLASNTRDVQRQSSHLAANTR